MSVKWEYDGKFWRFEPNPPDCEAAVFEVRGKFFTVVNGWSPCIRVEEYLDQSPQMVELRSHLPEGSVGAIPHTREFGTLESAQAYCEQQLRESVIRSAIALGIQAHSDTGTISSVFYLESVTFPPQLEGRVS